VLPGNDYELHESYRYYSDGRIDERAGKKTDTKRFKAYDSITSESQTSAKKIFVQLGDR